MDINIIFSGFVLLSLLIWTILLVFWGQFWRANQLLEKTDNPSLIFPSVCAIVPARDEADLLPVTLTSLLCQNYSGRFFTILVDDRSTDGTANVAEKVARELNQSRQLKVITSQPLPPGWSGKLWALSQGIRHANGQIPPPDYFLLTDADIEHSIDNLVSLVAKAEKDCCDLVSLMVLLRCQSFWEKFLIPAFVFFFQKLYPFMWVNDPNTKVAAAAGGCILIRRQALEKAGGIEAICQALIDDCALAKAVKLPAQNSKIWLGLTTSTRSLRAYDSLKTIWDMVARSAFTQLNYSPLLLLFTSIAMIVIYLVPPSCLTFGLLSANWLLAASGLLVWLMMSLAYFPTIRLYGISPLWTLSLPAISFFYTLMTIDSALQHWQGRGGAWKGRVYALK